DRRFSKFFRAIVLGNDGQYAKAIDEFTDLIKTDRSNPVLYYFRADNCATVGKNEQAISDYSTIISLHPRVAAINFVAETGRTTKTEGGYDEAVISLGDIFFLRGSVYFKTGSLDKALADFAETTRLNPSDCAAYLARVDVWLQKHD